MDKERKMGTSFFQPKLMDQGQQPLGFVFVFLVDKELPPWRNTIGNQNFSGFEDLLKRTFSANVSIGRRFHAK